MSKPHQMDHRKAECLSRFGYGNGRAGKEFCTSECKVPRKCWRKSVQRVRATYPPGEMLKYSSLVQRYLREGASPTKARRLTLKRLIAQGKVDPYMDFVCRNTREGVAARFADLPEPYKEFKGGLWYFVGMPVGMVGDAT